MGRRRRQFSPPPPPPPPPAKIFAGAYARPETGMDFGLAFMTPRSQTVNVAQPHECRRNIRILVETDILFVFFEVLRKVFEFADKA